ncbi:hypothetical protein EDC04DRAFT_2891202 [Pisolithus marmoratus]|nr:hypothetical protein EDC04DRAFT_2891202 [Pisolithus marmoratus]
MKDGTKSTGAIKPNFWGKEMPFPDTLAADVVGVQQSGRSRRPPKHPDEGFPTPTPKKSCNA